MKILKTSEKVSNCNQLFSIAATFGLTDPGVIQDVAMLVLKDSRLPSDTEVKMSIERLAKSKNMPQSEVTTLRFLAERRLKLLTSLDESPITRAVKRSNLAIEDKFKILFHLNFKLFVKMLKSRCSMCKLLKECEFGTNNQASIIDIARVNEITRTMRKSIHKDCPVEFSVIDDSVNQLASSALDLIDSDSAIESKEIEAEVVRFNSDTGAGSVEYDFTTTALPEDSAFSVMDTKINELFNENLLIFTLGAEFDKAFSLANSTIVKTPSKPISDDSTVSKNKSVSDLPSALPSQMALPDSVKKAKLYSNDINCQSFMHSKKITRTLHLLVDCSSSMYEWAFPEWHNGVNRRVLAATLMASMVRRSKKERSFITFTPFATMVYPSKLVSVDPAKPESYDILETVVRNFSANGGGTCIAGSLITFLKFLTPTSDKPCSVLIISDADDSITQDHEKELVELRNKLVKETKGKFQLLTLDVSGRSFKSSPTNAMNVLSRISHGYYKVPVSLKDFDPKNIVELVKPATR
jgi:hypothetical protein